MRVVDRDECDNDDFSDCDPNALCTNTDGSYVCRCLKGYMGDGKNCTGIIFFFLSLFSWLCLFAFYVRAATFALDIIAEQFYIHFYSSKLLQPDLAQLF